jgi:hypothetical protein
MDYMTSFSGSFYTNGTNSTTPSPSLTSSTGSSISSPSTAPSNGPPPSTNNPTINTASESIKGCFFIHDDFHNENEEEATGDELLLFFYPTHVPPNSRLFIIGGCIALRAFAKGFTKSPVTMLTMERVKFAVKEEGNITMALSTDINDPDSAVLDHLDAIYRAFKFFNGSFSTVQEV